MNDAAADGDASVANDAAADGDASVANDAAIDGGGEDVVDGSSLPEEGGSNCGFGTAGGSCSPQPLGSCQPSYVPVVQAKGSCTAQDVTNYFDFCMGDCNGLGLSAQTSQCHHCESLLSSHACFSCLNGFSNAAPWGLVVNYVGTSAYWLNVAGCFAALGASTACVGAEEELVECESAACIATCRGADASVGLYQGCIAAADQGECASYATARAVNCPAAIVNASACANSPDAGGGILDSYTMMAQTMCE